MSPASAAESAPQQLTSTITALRHAAKRDKAIEDQKEALRARDPMQAAADYVDIFDLRRRSTMYLTYWTAGDTRNRGREMHAFAQAYRITALKNCLNDLRRQELCLTLRCLSASYRE
jgi:nitrate reductase molybdenum cofactor assembly chaperone